MPLLDHFRPPVKYRLPWESLHSNWATRIADRLNEILPARYQILENIRLGGGVEIDVAAAEEEQLAVGRTNGPTTAVLPSTWAPPAPARTIDAVFPDTFEIRVYDLDGGRKLVGAIELVSEGNKDRESERRAFAVKCASYLANGVSLIVIDVVTTRRANMHNEIARLIDAPEDVDLPPEPGLYAVSYRPVLRESKPLLDLWFETFSVGSQLPTMPLRLIGDLFVPVDFESAYTEACRSRRVI
ncbi:MAG TPA: DUF4058 family protein [Fimbriiglobus sp.]|nr:DUF4058 family protein [Fimbriiglobus sp.]